MFLRKIYVTRYLITCLANLCTLALTFTIPYDRQGLADYLNADRSALSSELSKLQKEGVLSYKKRPSL